MRCFEIIDGSRRNAKPCATLYYDAANHRLATKLCDWAGEVDLPMTLGAFAARGDRAVGDEWTRRWIDERVVPTGRQNLGQVLKANGLEFYDAFELFVKAEGRCCQDDFYIREVPDNSTATIGVPGERDSFSKSIAAELRKARIEAGLTQMEVAQKAGLKQSAVSKLESGKSNPTAELVEAYANALGKQAQLKLV